MFIWGGRLRNTASTTGVWSLNVAGPGSQVSYTVIEDKNASDFGYAYGVLISVMITSMLFTYTCGVLSQRLNRNTNTRQSLDHIPNDGTVAHSRRNGLRQDIIDTLPFSIFSKSDGNNVGRFCSKEKLGSNMEGQDEGDSKMTEKEDCCPICLLEYAEGDELRSLPCTHVFHKSCIDSWLLNSASCPSCRYSLDELTLLTTSPIPDNAAHNQSLSPASSLNITENATSVDSPPFFDFSSLLGRFSNILRSQQEDSVPTQVSSFQPSPLNSENVSENHNENSQHSNSLVIEAPSRRRRRLTRIRARIRSQRLRSQLEIADSGTEGTLEVSYSSSLEMSSVEGGDSDGTVNRRQNRIYQFQRRRVKRQRRKRRKCTGSALSDPLQPNSNHDISIV